MKIIIDSREKARGKSAIRYYRRIENDVTIQTLDYADYLFIENDKTVAYEFKTYTDFIQSTENGSVFEEVINQTNEYDYSFLLLYGDMKQEISLEYFRRNINYDYSEFQDYMSKLVNGARRRVLTICPVITVDMKSDAYLYKSFKEMHLTSKKCFDTKYLGGVKRPVKTGNILTHILCGVNGISTKKAETIIKELEIDNLYNLCVLDANDFHKVKGVGEKTAKNIWEFIHFDDI